MQGELINPNPVVHKVERKQRKDENEDDENIRDDFDPTEIFDLIRDINDPEHGDLTLEELNIVQEHLIICIDSENKIDIKFTPTIPHCSMVTLIGLCIRVRLIRSLPPRFKINLAVTPGTHMSEDAVNKQLNDKERVAAALENPNLLGVVNKCLANTFKKGDSPA
eukprot:c13875_g1_i3.p1 GENE.c13875_g1_i3~~c13875_g1_i3.p1  ORF type:complete len:165 (+),score=44.81 c13875_g1_i3:31-525(+)